MDPHRIENLEKDVSRLLQHFHGVGGDQTSAPAYYSDKPKRQILITLVGSNGVIKRQCLTSPSENAHIVYNSLKTMTDAEMTDANIKL